MTPSRPTIPSGSPPRSTPTFGPTACAGDARPEPSWTRWPSVPRDPAENHAKSASAATAAVGPLDPAIMIVIIADVTDLAPVRDPLLIDLAEIDDTTERLVTAAAQVFAERGYDGAGVQEIARRAGLTTGAIYSRFSGKAELLAEAIRQFTSCLLYTSDAADE